MRAYGFVGLLLFAGLVVERPAEGAYKLIDGKLINAELVAKFPAKEHFALGAAAMEQCDWKIAVSEFRIVSYNFPQTAYGQESFYFLGVAEYNLDELDFANDAFSEYLKVQNNPQYFESAMEFKFAIACRFKAGAKRHFFGSKQLPKWASGTDLATQIFDEVIIALPCHELAAQSLFAKGQLLREDRRYRDSIDVYQQVIRRFPKHELAPQSYLAISKLYLDQSQSELQNPDLLALAQLNLRRFMLDFPREEGLVKAECDVQEMKEIYAKGLYETGQFYERIGEPNASIIYYQNAIAQFPDTKVALLSQQRLSTLDCPLALSKETDAQQIEPLEDVENDQGSL